MTIQSLVDSISRIPVFGLVVRATVKSQRDQAQDMAASIAYFSFFSLFPLLLGIVAAASLFLDWTEIEARLEGLLADALPGSAKFVKSNLEALVRLRSAAGFVSILGLLWSAGKVFGAVNRGINNALGQSRNHSILLTPLRQFALSLAVSALLLVSVAISTGLEMVAGRDEGALGEGLTGLLTFADGHVVSFLFVFANLAWLYSLVPYEPPAWRDIFAGALLAALLFELGKTGFVLYLEHVAALDAVYGSVSSIIVMLLWFYFSAHVLLLGAELIAVRREAEAGTQRALAS